MKFVFHKMKFLMKQAPSTGSPQSFDPLRLNSSIHTDQYHLICQNKNTQRIGKRKMLLENGICPQEHRAMILLGFIA